VVKGMQIVPSRQAITSKHTDTVVLYRGKFTEPLLTSEESACCGYGPYRIFFEQATNKQVFFPPISFAPMISSRKGNSVNTHRGMKGEKWTT